MFIDNARWDGVPFLLKAGKALHSKRAEIRVQFRHVPRNLYKGKLGADLDNATNELVSIDSPVYVSLRHMSPLPEACMNMHSSRTVCWRVDPHGKWEDDVSRCLYFGQ